MAGLIDDSAGNLYGTTAAGGANGGGTIFKLDISGNETVLYSFGAFPAVDGAAPVANLVRDGVGNLYGTASLGGNFNNSCPAFGCGVVFKLDPFGNYTVLTTALDNPQAGLLLDETGTLYGTFAGQGKLGPDYGAIFKIAQ